MTAPSPAVPGESEERVVVCHHCKVPLIPSGGEKWRSKEDGSSACAVKDYSQPWTYHEPADTGAVDEGTVALAAAVLMLLGAAAYILALFTWGWS